MSASSNTSLSLDSDYFDPSLKKFVSVRELWKANSSRAVKCTVDARARVTNLHELGTALREALSVASLKEHDTVRQIQLQAESLVQEVHRRESELIALVAETAAVQRDHLAAVLERVDTVAASIESNLEVLREKGEGEEALSNEVAKAKFQATSSLGELLAESSYFRIVPPGQFTVSSRPIGMESHLAVAVKKGVLHVPSALTVPTNRSSMRIPCDPSATFAFGKAPGILRYIATLGGTRNFVNPVVEGAVAATSSAEFITGTIEDLFSDIAEMPPVECRTVSAPNSSITLDFGDHRCVEVHSYLLRHGHPDEHAALRSWKMLVSNDGLEWVEIDAQLDSSLGRSSFNEAIFSARRLSESEGVEHTRFRFVRLQAAGPNAAGEEMHHIEISRLELYGALFTV